MRSRCFALLAILLCTSAAARAFAAASLTPLGDLPGGFFYSAATGVSGDGSVVVGYSNSASGGEAFRWTSDGGIVGLGILPGDLFSGADGVSGDGSVVVGSSNSASGEYEAFRWSAAGGMQGLGYPPGGGRYTQATGVSGDGSVIVGASYSDAGYPNEAFRWTSGDGMVGLGYGSWASGVSADGSVVVGQSYSASGYEAFRWTSGGGMVGLGDLPGGSFYSLASGVSADGSMIVGHSSSASAVYHEAFRWTSDGGMVGLGILPGGELNSWARGVSADGSVVVGSSGDCAGCITQAFRWTADGGMRALWDVLLSHGVAPAADGWTRLEQAYGISHDGSTIVGYGTRNGNTEAFVAVIPTIVPQPLAGDYNGNGLVEQADLDLVLLNWGQSFDGLPAQWVNERPNIGIVDQAELDRVLLNWGNTAAGLQAATAVPEPGSLVLLGASSILLLRRRALRRPNKFLWAPGHFRARRQIMRSNVCAFLAVLLCTSAAGRAFAAASLTPLGDLPGDALYGVANDVSADGSVIVGEVVASPFGEAFRWTSDGGIAGLGSLPHPVPGMRFPSGASGVSGDGSVVIGWSETTFGISEAFRWTSDGGMVGLGDLPGGAFYSLAYSVSADGSVIVGRGSSASGIEAFRWTAAGGMQGLGDLPGGEFNSWAIGVSADGSVIVGWSNSASGIEAFRWTSDGGMVGLGFLPGGDFSAASGVNGDGSVIVGGSSSASGGQAFRWTSDGGMVGLGVLPGGSGSSASGVSADGSVIVGSSAGEAFRWTADSGMEPLWDLLLANGVDPAADGWTTLTEASAISADGNAIVGIGTRNGTTEAFVAVIPVVLQPGDYNGNGLVEQADLDLVLLNWGQSFDGLPAQWVNERPSIGIVGQAELDRVLLNWGNTAAGLQAATAVPEPGSLALLGVSSILLLRRRFRWRPNKLTVLACQALAAALTLMAAAEAAAIDTEPLNNSQLTADSLPLLPGTAISNFARLDGAGGDVDFFQTPLAAGEVLFGMVTPLAGLPTSFTPPDTVVGVFDDTGARTFNEDDDAGELADIELGYGSVFRFLSPAAADYRIGVSGSSDYEFDGAASGRSHTETGGYVLTAGRVNPAVPGGGFVDTDPANQTAAGADLISLTPGTARVAVAELTSGDVDFFRLDLKAGNVLSAMTAPLNDLGATFNSPDTLMGLFDSSGTNLLVANDDSGGYSLIFAVDPVTGEIDLISPDLSSDSPGDQFGGLASALRAFIPADGTYYLAVTGRLDDGFSGAHSETGAYALLVGVAVPEPGSALLTAIAIAACGLLRLVKPNRWIARPARPHRSRAGAAPTAPRRMKFLSRARMCNP